MSPKRPKWMKVEHLGPAEPAPKPKPRAAAPEAAELCVECEHSTGRDQCRICGAPTCSRQRTSCFYSHLAAHAEEAA